MLWSNEVAIRFYEKRNFERRTFLPRYYTIANQLEDGYCYVLYMNDGHPPWTFTYPLQFFKILKLFLSLIIPVIVFSLTFFLLII